MKTIKDDAVYVFSLTYAQAIEVAKAIRRAAFEASDHESTQAAYFPDYGFSIHVRPDGKEAPRAD